MRLLSVLLALWMLLQTCGYTPAMAAIQVTTERTADGLKGEVHLNKVGALLFSEGIAEMAGNTMEIKGKQKGQSTSGHLLTGTIFKVNKIDGRIHARVFFNDGPGLTPLTAVNCDERVELTDGSTVHGPIQQLTPTEVTASGQTIAMNTVKEIHSNRCFVIHALEGNAARMHLEPTCVTAAGPVHHKLLTKRNVIIAVVLAAVITTAITLPIVLTGHGGNNENETAAIYYGQTHHPPPFVPPPRPPAGPPPSP